MLLKSMYTQLKQILGNDYTIEQVESATRQQVINLLGTDDFTQTQLGNVKKLLIRDVKEKEDIANMLSIRDEIISCFPSAEFDKGRIGTKRFVTVWLDGKPEEVVD
jgi:hypothetical protein